MNNVVQAHRFLTQAAVTAARVFGRAFAEAYKQANASSAYRRANPSSSSTPSPTHSGLTTEEACRILNISPPKSGFKLGQNRGGGAAVEGGMEAEAEKYRGMLIERFKKLFDQNDPGKGGSFYLQSKVLRARERLESEVGRTGEAAEMGREEMPRMYKDR
ncbi:MAG: hypothetical protein Q9162_002962 [Coniocarpon cinnabarinum]